MSVLTLHDPQSMLGRIAAARAAADRPDPTGEHAGLLRLAAAQLLAGAPVDQVLADLARTFFIEGHLDATAGQTGGGAR